jgi:hypothetical protein
MRHHYLLLCNLLLFFLVTSAEAQTVRISGVGDLNLGTWMGSGNLNSQDTLCVYNLGNANYKIRATGSGAASAFTMAGGGNDLAYEVYFQDSGAFVQLTSGSYSDFTDANTVADDCGGVDNATLKVVATSAALSSVPAGNYSGTLTLLLETR